MTEQTVTTSIVLTGFGDRDKVRELSDRLMALAPGGKRMERGECIALAQISLAHGLDPFNGEAWSIPGGGLMVGIKGLRKLARRQASAENASYWVDIQQADPDVYGVAQGGVVYLAFLRDSATTQAWAKSVHSMTTAGIPYKEACEMIGAAPVVTGGGIATPDERSKMSIHARARKRAEADAIKQRYDVEFAEFSDTEPGDVIEAEFSNAPASASAEPEPVKTEQQLMSELGF